MSNEHYLYDEETNSFISEEAFKRKYPGIRIGRSFQSLGIPTSPQEVDPARGEKKIEDFLKSLTELEANVTQNLALKTVHQLLELNENPTQHENE